MTFIKIKVVYSEFIRHNGLLCGWLTAIFDYVTRSTSAPVTYFERCRLFFFPSSAFFADTYNLRNRASVFSPAVFKIMVPNILWSRPWSFNVTWRHRSRDQSIFHGLFAIGCPLVPSLLVKRFRDIRVQKLVRVHIHTCRKWFYILSYAVYCIEQTIIWLQISIMNIGIGTGIDFKNWHPHSLGGRADVSDSVNKPGGRVRRLAQQYCCCGVQRVRWTCRIKDFLTTRE